MTPEIRLVVPWIPPADVRGNNRHDWRVRTRAVGQVRLYGFQIGKAYQNQTGREDLPMMGLLQVKIDAYTPRDIDGDNLLIGYKGFFDGLGPERQTEGRVHPGAKLIADDRHIKRWAIEVHKGQERSVITIEQLENTATLL